MAGEFDSGLGLVEQVEQSGAGCAKERIERGGVGGRCRRPEVPESAGRVSERRCVASADGRDGLVRQAGFVSGQVLYVAGGPV